MKDPSHALLTGGVLAAAILAVVGGFLFFANVPEPGAAREQVMASAPTMNRADIDRVIAERNALAPRPSAVARAEAAADTLSTRAALDDMPLGAMASAAPSSAEAPLNTADTRLLTPTAGMLASNEPSESKDKLSASSEGEDLYRDGHGPEALAAWRAAAEAGDREAAYHLGVAYLDGASNGVVPDPVEAAKWLRMAAQANEPRAQFELGTLYERGAGVKLNVAEAAHWYLKAAERGHSQGEYNIATMLETGEGIAQDRIEALKFYTLAAAQGVHGQAVDQRARATDMAAPADPLLTLRQSMPPSDVEEAEKRAAAFTPIQD